MWDGARDSDGYGRIGKNRKRAHRDSWERANGRSVPDGMVVMHACDNPPCVNPMHLVVGTVADNNRDRHAKGRSKNLFTSGSDHPAKVHRGQAHWRAKLTDNDVRIIRSRHRLGETQATIAADFKINAATVSRIVRRVWRQEVT